MDELEIEVYKIEDETSSGKFGSPQNIIWLNREILKKNNLKVGQFYKIKFENFETITKIDYKKDITISKLLSKNLNIKKPKSIYKIQLSKVFYETNFFFKIFFLKG